MLKQSTDGSAWLPSQEMGSFLWSLKSRAYLLLSPRLPRRLAIHLVFTLYTTCEFREEQIWSWSFLFTIRETGEEWVNFISVRHESSSWSHDRLLVYLSWGDPRDKRKLSARHKQMKAWWSRSPRVNAPNEIFSQQKWNLLEREKKAINVITNTHVPLSCVYFQVILYVSCVQESHNRVNAWWDTTERMNIRQPHLYLRSSSWSLTCKSNFSLLLFLF